MVVDRIRTTISANEAKEARVVVTWMTAFFAARWVTILTASVADLEAFCQERAKTRKPSSMARLIGVVKQIFKALVGAGLRNDDPSVNLAPPPVGITFIDFNVDDSLVRELLDRHRSITMRASKRIAFVRKRRHAILALSAAGAFCTEIATLDCVDVGLTLAAREHIRIGRSTANERDLLLGAEGLRAIDDYLALRQNMTGVTSSALFVSHYVPFGRMDSRPISNEIGLAIKATGLQGMGLSPATLHRSLAGSALKAGHGGKVAAAAGGYSLLPFAKPPMTSASEMSDLIERHHPMSRMPPS